MLHTWVKQAPAMQIPAHRRHLMRAVEEYAAALKHKSSLSILVDLRLTRQESLQFCRLSDIGQLRVQRMTGICRRSKNGATQCNMLSWLVELSGVMRIHMSLPRAHACSSIVERVADE